MDVKTKLDIMLEEVENKDQIEYDRMFEAGMISFEEYESLCGTPDREKLKFFEADAE